MDRMVVVTVDFADGGGASTCGTLTWRSCVEVLAVEAPASGRHWAAAEVIRDAAARVSVAAARVTGVIAAPDEVVITHPPLWSTARVVELRRAAVDAGFPGERVQVHARIGPRTP